MTHEAISERYAGMRELALFAGAGGGILASRMLGWKTVAAVEIEPYCLNILGQRQSDGILDRFPLYADVRTFDGRPWRGKVDVISGGFPCQDISAAGKGLGVEHGERSGLWREYARILREVRPQYAFVENSPMLRTRGLHIILADLAEIGYDAAWKVLSAEECGAPHLRERMWIVAKMADTMLDGLQGSRSSRNVPRPSGLCSGTRKDKEDHLCDPTSKRLAIGMREKGSMGKPETFKKPQRSNIRNWGRKWWYAEPGMGRMAHGVANRVDRIKAIGNGQVPIVAARAFLELAEELED